MITILDSPEKAVESPTSSPKFSPSTPPSIDLAPPQEGHAASLLLTDHDLGLAGSPPSLLEDVDRPDDQQLALQSPPSLREHESRVVGTDGPSNSSPADVDKPVDQELPLQSLLGEDVCHVAAAAVPSSSSPGVDKPVNQEPPHQSPPLPREDASQGVELGPCGSSPDVDKSDDKEPPLQTLPLLREQVSQVFEAGGSSPALDKSEDLEPPQQSPPLTYEQIRENNIKERIEKFLQLGLQDESWALCARSKPSRLPVKKSQKSRPELSSSPPALRSGAVKSHPVPSGLLHAAPVGKGDESSQPRAKARKLSGPPPPPRQFDPEDPFGDGMTLEETSTFCARKVTTRPGYKHAWNHFCRHVGDETVVKLKQGTLTNAQVDTLIAQYIRTRVNIKVEKQTGIAQRLDTSSMQTLLSQLGTMFSTHTPYNFRKDNDCYKWRGVLQFVQQQAKKDGLGRLSHQASPLSVHEINHLFQHGSLTVWSPRGLQQLILLHLVTTFNVRVEEELRSVRFGDFRHVANKDGEVIYTKLLPRNTKKDTGGLYVIFLKPA